MSEKTLKAAVIEAIRGTKNWESVEVTIHFTNGSCWTWKGSESDVLHRNPPDGQRIWVPTDWYDVGGPGATVTDAGALADKVVPDTGTS